MPKHDEAVARMLEGYRNLIRRFVIGEVSADEFDILDGLFSDVDEYVSDPDLRTSAGGLSGEELRDRARDAYVRLFETRSS